MTCGFRGCTAETANECCDEPWCDTHIDNHQRDHEECAYCAAFAPCEVWEICGDSVMLCRQHNIRRNSIRCDACGESLGLSIGGEFWEAVFSDECTRCGDLIGEACQDSHDESCSDDDDESVIHSYDYTPSPIFHGEPPRYYGVELEVDDGQDQIAAGEALNGLHDVERLFYLKHDGSLSSVGFEIVTHPCTLQHHMEVFPWNAIIGILKSYEYKSHNTTTCGLHIHVSRKALGLNHTEQDLVLSNLILLYWRHWKEIVVFSRRKPSEIEEWCKLNYRAPIVFPIDYQELDESKRRGKYAAINTDHAATVEFRIFKGTLLRDSLIAAIQLTDVLIDLALTKSMSWIVASKWPDIVDACAKYHELTEYVGGADYVHYCS